MLSRLCKSAVHGQKVIIEFLFAADGVQAKRAFLGNGEDEVLKESETTPGKQLTRTF